MERTLILVRHGQSEWNLKNLFTGWKNPGLTEKGVEEAIEAGKLLKSRGYEIEVCYTSALARAQRTLDLMLENMGIVNMTIIRNQALNERDYGDLAGLNKDDAREKWGELTDDDMDVVEGKREQLVGKIQEKYGKSKDEAEREVDDWLNS